MGQLLCDTLVVCNSLYVVFQIKLLEIENIELKIDQSTQKRTDLLRFVKSELWWAAVSFLKFKRFLKVMGHNFAIS